MNFLGIEDPTNPFFHQSPFPEISEVVDFEENWLNFNTCAVELKEQMEIDIQHKESTNLNPSEHNSLPEEPQNVTQTKEKNRYQKNICGYILKAAFKAFQSPCNFGIILEICREYSVDYEKIVDFCSRKQKSTSGISTIIPFFITTKKQNANEKLALLEFVEWFLENQYVRHLIRHRKVANPQLYIQYKNTAYPKQIKELRAFLRRTAEK